MRRRVSLTTLLALSAAWVFALSGGHAAETPRSPFKPVNTGGAAAAAPDEVIEFAGVSQGKTTHLIFHDKTAKKNRWVELGETVEGISALKYDARLELAVVKINGSEKTLPLRKARGPVNSAAAVTPLPAAAGFARPMPLPAPVAVEQPHILPSPGAVVPAAPGTQAGMPQPAPPPQPAMPATQATQETEARMLVSDLLEIGMAQRKAYEEAQRRAAEGSTHTPSNGTPPPAPKQP